MKLMLRHIPTSPTRKRRKPGATGRAESAEPYQCRSTPYKCSSTGFQPVHPGATGRAESAPFDSAQDKEPYYQCPGGIPTLCRESLRSLTRVFSHALSFAFLTTLFFTTNTLAQPTRGAPNIGYVFPAGGQQGTTFQIYIGGQSLGGTTNAYITGEGITAKVIKHYRPMFNLSREQRVLLGEKMVKCADKQWSILVDEGIVDTKPPWADARRRQANVKPEDMEGVILPDNPLINNMENMSLRELQYMRDELLSPQKKQRNLQIAETVQVEITIDKNAQPGNRELRLLNRQGLSNPITFQVGTLPEVNEIETNDPVQYDPLPIEPPFELPVVINGQIMPGDVDRLRFKATKGQPLTIEVHARELIPYLADAVPGWFQSVITVYDPDGNEVIFADDYRYDPDPVLPFKVPKTGTYELEIHDSIYRGREDFVYRISIAPQPFITGHFPLGGQVGQETSSSITGWNLPTKKIALETDSGEEGYHEVAVHRGKRFSNELVYEVSTLNDLIENEPNNTQENAQPIEYPIVINGSIQKPGDMDVYKLDGRAGQEIVAEVTGRRLLSPIDSLIRLIDESGNILAWNDDYQHKSGFLHTEMGILTHHADSYLKAQLPNDGTYFIQMSDALNHGSKESCYRLRISEPAPDFELRIAPSSINIPAGIAAPIDIYVSRSDGFEGDIDLSLMNAPEGFIIDSTRIPTGRDHIRTTITAPVKRFDGPQTLQLQGRAEIDGQSITRAAQPVDNVMQAFLYRHLVPAQELMVAVKEGRRQGRPCTITNLLPIRIPVGGSTTIHVSNLVEPPNGKYILSLDNPPDGITIGKVTHRQYETDIQLIADANTPLDYADNLIIEVILEVTPRSRDEDKKQDKRRIPIGTLPAIPIKVVQR